MKEHKRWAIAAFVTVALTLGAIFVWITFRGVLDRDGVPGDAQTMQEMASHKEIAAALKDPGRREATVRALQASKDVAATDMLAALGYKSKDPEVRAAALTALGDIVEPDDIRGLQALTTGSRDESPAVRAAAIHALGRVATATAYAAVAAALRDEDLGVRGAAAQVLSRSTGSVTAEQELIVAFDQEVDVETRRTLAVALGRLATERARARLLAALHRRAEEQAVVRLAIVESLAARPDAHGIHGLVLGMCDGDATVRVAATNMLAALKAGAVTNIAEAVRSGPARGALAQSGLGAAAAGRVLDKLVAIGTPETADAFVQLLDIAVGEGSQVRNADLRDRVVAQLVALGAAAVPPIAADVLQSDVRLAMKTAVAEALVGIGAPAIPAVRAYVESRKVLPNPAEARLWAGVFDRIGGEGAAAAAAAARARDPEEVFRRYAASLPPVSTEQPPAPQLEEWFLVLHKGMYPDNPPSTFARRTDNLPFLKTEAEPEIEEYRPTGRCNIAFDLVRLTNGWSRALGHSSTFNSVVFGKIERMVMTEAAMEGRLRAQVYRDPYLVGGSGEYEVSLQRQKDGNYRGTYKGSYRDVPIEGIATCVLKPKRGPLPAGFRPVEPNEHPRLLFRKWELPALRARLATPFGKAAFQRLATRGVTESEGTVYGHVEMGMLYQLTGDEKYALAAIPVVERAMQERDFGFMGLGQIWGPRWSNIAYAYDLCYDAWPAQFRAKVSLYMLRAVRDATFNMGKFSSSANTHPCSNYFSPIVGGASMLALALWMEPGGEPIPPPGSKLHEPAMLSERPGADVPVTPLKSNESPANWLFAGPIYLPVSTDEMVEMVSNSGGGPVRDGQAIKIGEKRYVFGPPPPEAYQGGEIYPWNTIKAEMPECSAVGILLFTVLDNARPGYYRVVLPRQGMTHCSINGMRLADGVFVHLEAGLYPLLVAFTGDGDTMVPVGARFRFLTASRKEIDILIADAAQKSKGEQVAYELDLAEHRLTGMDGARLNAVQRSFDHMTRSHRLLFGTGGYQSEGEMYHHTADTPIRYAAACWNVFGQTLTPFADVRLSAVRFLAHGLLHERKDGGAALVWQSFNGGNYNATPPGFISAGFRFTPEEYKPALLWLWNRMAGVNVNDPESYVKLLNKADVVQTFVNYPLDPGTGLSSIKPRHPDEVVPKSWRSEDKGLHAFRNRWRDNGDIVLQVYANELMSKGHGQPDAGGIRLHGLGYDWTNDSPGKGAAYRHLQNVVLLPPDIGMARMPGRVTSWRGETDGSGRVSIDMNLVYSGTRGQDWIFIWPPDPIPPGEVTGLRAVAADYSGKCGAPALFVFVDKIEGGPDRFWLWNPPGGDGGRVKTLSAKDLRVDTAGSTFSMFQDKASLRAVFVAPRDAVVEAPGTIEVRGVGEWKTKYAKELKKDKKFRPPPEPVEVPIMAKGKPGESFFVVMTMQEGPAPEVSVVKGSGLDSVVRIGGRIVRFDGKNAIIEDAGGE